MAQINLSTNRNRLTGIENKPAVAMGEGGKDWEFGVSRYKLVYIKWLSSEVLLHRELCSVSCDKP